MITQLTILQADITTLSVDVIVNAANETLLGGGGVDGAIHSAAGPELLAECKTLGGCRKGEAKITNGYNLPAKYVIHTVGPVYGQENGQEDKILANCYNNCLRLAKEQGCKTIAFPCISTGAFRFPKDEAAKIAVNTVRQFIEQNDCFEKIIFVAFEDLDFNIYQKILCGIYI